MVKCPFCPKKFPTHHGLGGHVSGPCGIKLRAAKAKAKAKAITRKPAPKLTIDFGKEMNAELRADARARIHAAIPGKVADDMIKLAEVHRQKAEELEKMAKRMRVLA